MLTFYWRNNSELSICSKELRLYYTPSFYIYISVNIIGLYSQLFYTICQSAQIYMILLSVSRYLFLNITTWQYCLNMLIFIRVLFGLFLLGSHCYFVIKLPNLFSQVIIVYNIKPCELSRRNWLVYHVMWLFHCLILWKEIVIRPGNCVQVKLVCRRIWTCIHLYNSASQKDDTIDNEQWFCTCTFRTSLLTWEFALSVVAVWLKASTKSLPSSSAHHKDTVFTSAHKWEVIIGSRYVRHWQIENVTKYDVTKYVPRIGNRPYSDDVTQWF